MQQTRKDSTQICKQRFSFTQGLRHMLQAQRSIMGKDVSMNIIGINSTTIPLWHLLSLLISRFKTLIYYQTICFSAHKFSPPEAHGFPLLMFANYFQSLVPCCKTECGKQLAKSKGAKDSKLGGSLRISPQTLKQ